MAYDPNNPFQPFNTSPMSLLNVGGFRQPGDNQGLAPQNVFNQQQFNQNQQSNDLKRRQQLGNMLLAFSDVFRGKDPSSGVLQRQQLFRQQQEEERRKKLREEYIKQNPQMAEVLSAIEAGIPYQLLEEKPVKGPSSYEEYVRTDPTPTFEEYKEFLLEKEAAGATRIDTAQKAKDYFAQEGIKAGFATKKEIDEQIQLNSQLLDRIKLSKDLLLEGVETGPIEEFLKPFRSFAINLGVADEETIQNYTQQELFSATTDYLVPRMRVVGSGATSDREIELFKSTVPTLGRTTKGNLVIAAGLEAMFEYNKKRGFLADQYLQDNNSLLGFGAYADQELGPLYESYSSDQEFDQKVRDGKLKAGDFVLDQINGQFRVLTEEDVQGI